MKINGSYEIKLNINSVWEALNNPEILKKSIPGCEEFSKNSNKNFSAIATNKIGPFNATFTGSIELKDLNPPNSYKIFAQGNSPVGFVSGEALVKLEENNGITKLTYSVDANVGGKIAQLGSRLIDITAKKMADIFFRKFSELISPTKDQDKRIDQDKVYLEKKISPKKINKKLIYLMITIVILLAIYLMK